jgi:hypothetical protein
MPVELFTQKGVLTIQQSMMALLVSNRAGTIVILGKGQDQ